MSEGFDDIEMRNRNMKEEEEDREALETGETSGGNFADTNLDTGETTRLLPLTSQTDQTGQNEVRVENLDNTKSRKFYDKFKKGLSGIKRSITNDKKNFFEKIFNFTPEKKNGENSKKLLEETTFVKDEKGNVSIFSKMYKLVMLSIMN